MCGLFCSESNGWVILPKNLRKNIVTVSNVGRRSLNLTLLPLPEFIVSILNKTLVLCIWTEIAKRMAETFINGALKNSPGISWGVDFDWKCYFVITQWLYKDICKESIGKNSSVQISWTWYGWFEILIVLYRVFILNNFKSFTCTIQAC